MKINFQMDTDAELENLAQISDFITHAMAQFGLNEKTVYQIQIAVDEACTNIINYAYPQKKGKINIRCLKKDNQIYIVIKDWGKPWDPQSVEEPLLNADLDKRKIGGMGIYFIRTFMDEVIYQQENGKNTLTLIKSVKE